MEVTGQLHTAATKETNQFTVLSVKIGRKSEQYGEEKILLTLPYVEKWWFIKPRHSLYIYKDLSLDHNLNQVSVFFTLIPCVIVMLIEVVSSLACIFHFPMHIQYLTILIHLDFIAFIIYDKEHKFWRSSLSSSLFLSLPIYSPISLFSNTLHLQPSLRVENNPLYLCKRG